MLLAGDIGGTKTNLAFFEVDGPRLRTVAEATYPSHGHPGPQQILQAFLTAHARSVERICLGIAGPVHQGRVVTPNLPWTVDAAILANAFGCPVNLLNDLEANAHGLRVLAPEDFAVLNPGSPDAAGNAALISAGTGLGEAGLYWDGTRHHPFASEGGHADFAPTSPLEWDLVAYLDRPFGHMSYERVLSGPGLHNIYNFLRQRSGADDELRALQSKLGISDPSAAISQLALSGQNRLCEQALDLFVSIYGAEAGNLALKLLATGGVFLGGGIAPKILPKLRQPNFLDAFVAKGRMKALLESIPIRVVLNPKAALLGAARYAADLLQ